MNTADFDFILPKEHIAQYPLPERDQSRLMVVHRNTQVIEHKVFSEIVDFFSEGDCLVINNSKVFPARLFGLLEKTAGRVEVFIIRRSEGQQTWEVMTYPGKKTARGTRIRLGENGCVAEVVDVQADGRRIIRVNQDDDGFKKVIDDYGHIPLPPYIDRNDEPLDKERYQTVYAQADGSVAAPTAGLHFTTGLLESVKARGVEVVPVILHVGPGTFRPVKTEAVERHIMDKEFYSIEPDAKEMILKCRQQGKRVWAVGTTTTRVLETMVRSSSEENEGWTDLFVYPGYEFKMVDGLITNFHLPKSTLLMLVAAFAGRDLIKKAYQEAIENKYRFYSYGDAMLIL